MVWCHAVEHAATGQRRAANRRAEEKLTCVRNRPYGQNTQPKCNSRAVGVSLPKTPSALLRKDLRHWENLEYLQPDNAFLRPGKIAICGRVEGLVASRRLRTIHCLCLSCSAVAAFAGCMPAAGGKAYREQDNRLGAGLLA